jgi:hypothetical protein
VLGTIVETKNLLEAVAASLVAGVGVAVAFSVLIFGVIRLAELRRDERPMLAAAAAALAAVGLLITVGGIVLGIVVMTTK